MRKERTYTKQALLHLPSRVVIAIVSVCWLLLLHAPAFSQSSITDSIVNRTTAYHQQRLQEKLYLHTTKALYVTGEILWFKLYAVDGYVHQPLNINKVAYIELLSAEGKPVWQSKIDLSDGHGSGSLLIPASLGTGHYTLRAYTAWMKNFDADYYFHQTITIVNTLKRPDWQKLQKAATYHLQLFPEGGNLVQGLESKISFRVVNSSGQGQEAAGVVLNASNDTVQQFKTHRFGMGHFRMTPQRGQRYQVQARLPNGEQVVADLPPAFEQGAVMSVRSLNQDQLAVTVTTNSTDQQFSLLVQCRQQIKATATGSVINGQVQFTLSRKELGDGINQLTLFNTALQPVCERLYFNPPQNGLTITAEIPKAVYGPRQRVDVRIRTQDRTQTPLPAHLTLSVHLAETPTAQESPSIESYLLLTSDLKGTIENPSYYFSHPEAEVAEALDNLMLTHGWSRYKWEDIFAASPLSRPYLPEYEGHLLHATITNGTQAASNTPVYLAVPGSKPYLSYAVSNAKGQLQFVIKRTQGVQELMAQFPGNTSSRFTLNITDPFSQAFAARSTPAFNLPESAEAHLLQLNQSMQVQNSFRYAQYQQFLAPTYFDTTAFYGQPDKTYYLDDYTRFTTLEEVMREYVAEVRVRKRGDQFHYEVKNTPYQTFFTNNPLVLLDGVPITDLNELMAVDPLKIQKIEVVARKYFWGPLTYEGIVSYSSYDGALAESPLDANTLRLAYEGTQLQREFFTPVYETKEQQESRLPDFRSQLHWAPHITTGGNGEYTLSLYTSDLEGDYVLTIQGLTADGQPGSTRMSFRVSKDVTSDK